MSSLSSLVLRLWCLLALLCLAAPSVRAQTVLVVGPNYVVGSAGGWQNLSFPVPASYSSGWDIVIIARPALLVTTNPANAEVDVYVTSPGIAYPWYSAQTGRDAVIINAQIPSTGRNSTAEALLLGGPLSTTPRVRLC